MQAELDNIVARYERRKQSDLVQKNDAISHYRFKSRFERYLKYIDILKNNQLLPLENKTILEVGAGEGDHLLFFHNLGIPWENIYGNELLLDRFEELGNRLSPKCHLQSGNALDLPYEEKFDIVLQSTVFSSILDKQLKKELAQHLLTMVKKEGVIIWYDFVYNNPNNKDVQGISRSEIKALFPKAKSIDFHSVTMAPPLGRRVGKMYGFLNTLFPFLRTHVIAVITK